MSRISASWPVAGDGLRMGSSESTVFPTSVKAVVILLMKLRLSIPHAMGGPFTRGMASVSLACNRRLHGHSSACF
jgi:hypothetical protein